MQRPAGGRDDAAAVGPGDDIGREDREHLAEVPAEAGLPELLDDLALLGRLGGEAGAAGPDVFAGPVGALADARPGLPDDLRDLGVGVSEHLAEHEDRALGGGQGLQYDQDRHGDGVGQFGFLGDVGRGEEGFGKPGSDIRLADDLGRPEPVEAQVRDGAHQIGAGFSTAVRSARCQASQASCTMSSASATLPSMR